MRQPHVDDPERGAPRVLGDPQPGFWMVRLVKGGPRVPAMICRQPHEPGNPFNPLDRSPRSMLHAEIDGQAADVDHVWGMRGEPIDEAEYRYQVDLGRWAKHHAPGHPRADPRSRIDLLRAPLPLFRKG